VRRDPRTERRGIGRLLQHERRLHVARAVEA